MKIAQNSTPTSGSRAAALPRIALLCIGLVAASTAQAEAKKTNIVIIWGDDIGITNVSAYSRGLMGYTTPNIDRLAKEGMIFTDYYGEQSCTAGRSAFITGQSVFRTGLSKVGIPGAAIGLQKADPTIAEMLRPLGYATGQFGKNHLGDKDEYLPCVHGFDEFYGNLYHLNAEEDPEEPDYPKGPSHWCCLRTPGCDPLLGDSQRGPAHRGHRPAEHQAHGDDRRRHRRSCRSLARDPGQGRQAGLSLGELHAHAFSHAYQAAEPGLRPARTKRAPMPTRWSTTTRTWAPF